jgi:hypothetical protein
MIFGVDCGGIYIYIDWMVNIFRQKELCVGLKDLNGNDFFENKVAVKH